MELPLLLCLVISTATSQQIDAGVLAQVFGVKEKAEVPKGSTEYEDQCQCVPYYFCDRDLNANHLYDPAHSVYGKIDMRFQECQESVERCCKIPKIPTINHALAVPPVEPDASRLKGCGYRNVKGLDFTLTGGKGNEAQFGEFPWVVAILNAYNNTYHGVGVLIHPQVVMTAAHIVEKLELSSVKIRAGEWDTQTDKERLRSQERLADNIIIHENFNAGNLQNDMALLKLAEPVQLADHINVICLPDQDESFDGYKGCVANGWGKTSFGRKGSYAVILKKVEMDTVPNPLCNIKLKRTRLGHFFRLHSSFMCAGGQEGVDTCGGDGGAPLACPIGDNQYKLSGLVAWGIGCGQQGVPSVYVGVPKFRDWVDSIMATWNFDTSSYKI